jgi:hypothetical protein
MKHETQLAVLRTQGTRSLWLDEPFVSGEIDPKLCLGALANGDHEMSLKLRLNSS